MCYYSLSMRPGTFRAAKQGDDLVVSSHDGHGIARSQRDGMVVCIPGGTELHMARFDMTLQARQAYLPVHPWLNAMIGKPLTAQFREGGREASDVVVVCEPNRPGVSVLLHLSYLKHATTFYIGPKRPTLEDKLGVGDPPVIHDPLPIDEAPTLMRTMGRMLGVCSIWRD